MQAVIRPANHHAEPGKVRAAFFSLLVHLVFFSLLVFGLSWKSKAPEAIVVELWQNFSETNPIKPTQPVKPTAPAQPVAQKPEPKVEPKLQPVESKSPRQPAITTAEPSPPLRKPAIPLKAIKEKLAPQQAVEKLPKPVKETAPKPPPDKDVPKKPVEKKIENTRTTEQKKQQEQERLALKAKQGQMLDEIAKYKAMIQAKIRSRIVMPPDLPGNPVAEFRVILLPGGDVLSVDLRRSSGFTVFDDAVERAVYLAKPLPLPPDPTLFREFRDFSLTVYYRE
ncbi:MAG: cell envelope integrity protein TolA [Nitrosomonas sp.]|nr:cell envelope integrity protein TolA [Nitrosomonas sp.]